MRILIAIMMTAMVIMIMIEIAVSEVATLIIVRILYSSDDNDKGDDDEH